jgi:lipopolysaccharide transport system permease protein
MIVFSDIFGRLAGLPSEEIPYPIFTFAALLPWQ